MQTKYKVWVEKGSEFYNRSMKSLLEKNNIEMYSTHNEEKFVESFIKPSKLTLIKTWRHFQKTFILIN